MGIGDLLQTKSKPEQSITGAPNETTIVGGERSEYRLQSAALGIPSAAD